jgi:hypothetical protein
MPAYEFQNLPQAIYNASIAYAKSHSQYEYLYEMKKVTLAGLMKNMNGSQASKEMEAMADPKYEEFLERLRDAHHEALRDKAHLTARQSEFELQRSLESTRRAEINLR